eukprot:TRINITY_DN2495_c0_g1_i1.p1 TRINITY_DN2495_c0_g1~~TRINITY_DN2495_c0_g1_i1.p1  ORF type:complete len:408 (+),score=145.07 TRINITY_DN2495_c0_g1_i1:38-1261(+)
MVVRVLIYVDRNQFSRAAVDRLVTLENLFSNNYGIIPSRQNITIDDYAIIKTLKQAPANQGTAYEYPQVIVCNEVIGKLSKVMEAHESGMLKSLIKPDETENEMEGSMYMSQVLYTFSEEKRVRVEEDERKQREANEELARQRADMEREQEKLRLERERIEAERKRAEEDNERKLEAENKRIQEERARLEREHAERARMEKVMHDACERVVSMRAAAQAKIADAKRRADAEAQHIREKEVLAAKSRAEIEAFPAEKRNNFQFIETMFPNLALDTVLNAFKSTKFSVDATLNKLLEEGEKEPAQQRSTPSATTTTATSTSSTSASPAAATPQQSAVELELEMLRQENNALKAALSVHLPAIKAWVDDTSKMLEADMAQYERQLELKRAQMERKSAMGDNLAKLFALLQ